MWLHWICSVNSDAPSTAAKNGLLTFIWSNKHNQFGGTRKSATSAYSPRADPLKGIVHPKMKMWCLSAYPQGIQDVDDFVSSVEHKWRFLTQKAVCQLYNGSQCQYVFLPLIHRTVQLSWARAFTTAGTWRLDSVVDQREKKYRNSLVSCRDRSFRVFRPQYIVMSCRV